MQIAELANFTLFNILSEKTQEFEFINNKYII